MLQAVASWGESLKNRRLAAGLSPEQLGAKAGVTGETIRRIERGHDTTPSTRHKIDVALEAGSDADRISQLEREVVELRRDLAALVGFAERLVSQQEPRPADRQSGPRGR
jgi:hypothetical protein